MTKIRGSCLCGAIQYSASADPLFMVNCHCRSCQKTSGSMFSAIVGIPASALALEGDTLNSYASRGDSGKPIHRNFCSNCGTLIFARSENTPEVVYLRAGTIDSQFAFEPQANVYWRDHQSWLPADIPCYATMPAP